MVSAALVGAMMPQSAIRRMTAADPMKTTRLTVLPSSAICLSSLSDTVLTFRRGNGHVGSRACPRVEAGCYPG